MADDRPLSAVVVGSGPNGLAAAIALARAGVRVVVLEATGHAGGGLRSAEDTLPGYLHDRCSAIHPLAVGSPAFAGLPLGDHGLEWIHPPAPLAHPLDDGAVLCERSLDATAAGLGPDGDTWRELFGPLVRDWPLLADEILGPVVHLPRHPLLLARFGLAALRPASSLARARFRGERARALFAGIAAHSILPLERAASAAVALVLGAAAHAAGWPFPRGGAQRLADALVGVLGDLGGELRTGVEVRTPDDLPPHDVALFDVAPRALSRIAGRRLPARYRRRLERFRHGPGVCKLDWALDGPIPWRDAEVGRAATVHVGGTLAEIAAAEALPWRGEHAERPFVLLAQHTLFDPGRAPDGGHTAWGYCHVPSGSAVDMTGPIETQIERFAPGFTRRILARSVRTARDVEAGNANLVGGDISGGVADLGQLLARPRLLRPYATPNPALFLCSASTPPGGGVHGMCGDHAARVALSRLRHRGRAG